MTQTAPVTVLTRKNRTGLALAAVLGLLDLTNLFDVPVESSDPDAAGPPQGIVIADGILGVITLVAVWFAWRRADRTASRVVAGSRILSVITSLPALFVSGVPAWVVALVAVSVIASVVVIALVLSRPAPQPGAAA
ncbi:hypothetical protein ABZ848_11580 [Streptomyces sp. NPDC047081]|uniref:hypothetical protein n=1 Tax=Streptomyces sp. NPDC047081 TaxID=3154706 RepID=UPI0033DA9B00